MKKLIILVLAIFSTLNLSAQETVTNRNGKEFTVNNDATSSQKGSVKLTGDLGGTADAPTVPALSSKIDGTGTINFIPKFTGVKSLGNSLLYDNGTFLGLGTNSPGNKLEITQGTAGNSGLRFTNLNSASTVTTSSSKVLGLNSLGDVILTNVPGTQNIVDFSTATPTSAGVVFTPNSPADESVVYQSAVDNSMWTYNGTTYVTYTAPVSTAWYLGGTTNDAGSNKTSSIWRSGNVGIGINNPSTTLHIQNPLTATTNANANAQVLRLSRPTTSNLKWDNIAQFNLGSYSTAIAAASRLDLALTNGLDATTLTNVMTWQANGNVGINNTAPSAPLVVQGVTGTGALKLIAPSVATGDNWWLGFGHGTTSTDANDRARIGVDISGGGPGRLFFTTGPTGTQTRAMFIDESQRIGIGTSAPTGQLEVATSNGLSSIIRRFGNTTQSASNLILQKTYGTTAITHGAGISNGDYLGRILFSASNGSSYPLNGTDIVGYAAGLQSTTNNGGGIFFRTVPQNSVAQSIERMRIDENGNIGIGTTTPKSSLEVNGSATNSTAFNAAAGTSIDFSKSNLAYSTANPGSFSLTNMKDGGTYTLAVQGSTSGTASFSGSNPSNTAFTFLSINNGATIAGKQTLYTFIVMGTTVYFYMAAGF